MKERVSDYEIKKTEERIMEKGRSSYRKNCAAIKKRFLTRLQKSVFQKKEIGGWLSI